MPLFPTPDGLSLDDYGILITLVGQPDYRQRMSALGGDIRPLRPRRQADKGARRLDERMTKVVVVEKTMHVGAEHVPGFTYCAVGN